MKIEKQVLGKCDDTLIREKLCLTSKSIKHARTMYAPHGYAIFNTQNSFFKNRFSRYREKNISNNKKIL